MDVSESAVADEVGMQKRVEGALIATADGGHQ